VFYTHFDSLKFFYAGTGESNLNGELENIAEINNNGENEFITTPIKIFKADLDDNGDYYFDEGILSFNWGTENIKPTNAILRFNITEALDWVVRDTNVICFPMCDWADEGDVVHDNGVSQMLLSSTLSGDKKFVHFPSDANGDLLAQDGATFNIGITMAIGSDNDQVREFESDITCEYYDCPALGDLNADGGFNVLDVVKLANCVLANDCTELEHGCATDMNGDGGVNVLDIVTLVNCVLANNCGG